MLKLPNILPVSVAVLAALCLFFYVRLTVCQDRVEALERSCSSMEAALDTMERSMASTQKNLLEWSRNLDELKADSTRRRTEVRTAISALPWASVPVPPDVVRMLQ